MKKGMKKGMKKIKEDLYGADEVSVNLVRVRVDTF
jgi:hypothetical protein